MSALNHSLCLFKDHIGNLDVSFSWFIECRCYYFCLYAAGHVCNLLRTLVDKQYDHVDLRMVVGDGIGNRFQEHCLTCLWLCHDKSALSLSG